MAKTIRSLDYQLQNSVKDLLSHKLIIEELNSNETNTLVALIRNNLKEFNQQENLFSMIHRRLDNFSKEYSRKGSSLIVARTLPNKQIIASIGLGSFQGLPSSERIGEVRDLVVQKEYRQQGLGQKLLRRALLKAKDFGYMRLYLEVSQHMQVAHKLFCQNGFHPVKHLPSENKSCEKPPSYFLLGDLNSQLRSDTY
jgi:GNAT superfamily N-acetyltransferase